MNGRITRKLGNLRDWMMESVDSSHPPAVPQAYLPPPPMPQLSSPSPSDNREPAHINTIFVQFIELLESKWEQTGNPDFAFGAVMQWVESVLKKRDKFVLEGDVDRIDTHGLFVDMPDSSRLDTPSMREYLLNRWMKFFSTWAVNHLQSWVPRQVPRPYKLRVIAQEPQRGLCALCGAGMNYMGDQVLLQGSNVWSGQFGRWECPAGHLSFVCEHTEQIDAAEQETAKVRFMFESEYDELHEIPDLLAYPGPTDTKPEEMSSGEWALRTAGATKFGGRR